jgi:2,3-bisphosphoglycerate-dependent phosphoglycerate mutase
MPVLVLVRHGESQYNLENRFTGWLDIPLTPNGKEEAIKAAKILQAHNLLFKKAYSSTLSRAIDSLNLILELLHQERIPVETNSALNERHYGELQGLNKSEAAQKFGEEQVRLWRRSFDVKPPGGESLEDTAKRVLPYFHSNILADIRVVKNVLVVAHGNSLRAIVMDLDKLTKEAVERLEIPTGKPILYEFDDRMNLILKQELL